MDRNYPTTMLKITLSRIILNNITGNCRTTASCNVTSNSKSNCFKVYFTTLYFYNFRLTGNRNTNANCVDLER